MNDPKVDVINCLRIFYKWYDFGVKRSKVKVTWSQSAKSDRVAGLSYALYRLPSRPSILTADISIYLNFISLIWNSKVNNDD